MARQVIRHDRQGTTCSLIVMPAIHFRRGGFGGVKFKLETHGCGLFRKIVRIAKIRLREIEIAELCGIRLDCAAVGVNRIRKPFFVSAGLYGMADAIVKTVRPEPVLADHIDDRRAHGACPE